MIHTIKKLPGEKFEINDALIVSNFDFDDEGVSYSIDYDEKLITQLEAEELAHEFISEALNTFIKKD